MMSEEEKKVINKAKRIVNIFRTCNHSSEILLKLDIEELEILINLTEKQLKEIEFYKREELGYIAGYEDGKRHKQTAVAMRNENAQYEIIRKNIERKDAKIEQLQKEIEQQAKEIERKNRNIHKLNLDKIQQQKEIEELKEKNGVLQNELNKKIEALDKAMNNPDYISKNKIKEIFYKYEKLECITMTDFSNFVDDIKKILEE